MNAFLELYSTLDRQGPGLPEDVAWALDEVDLSADARICDAGCGTGADTVTLARLRPQARIVGIEQAPAFVRAAKDRTRDMPKVEIREGDMATPNGPYDFIWCAGALYFLGVTEGLRGWRSALSEGGTIAFSEPCYLTDPPSDAARAFWSEEYPSITGIDGLKARVAAAGYETRAVRFVRGEAWEAYFRPLEARIAADRPEATGEMAEVLDAAEREIAAWRAGRDDIAYALLLVQPS
ncbi:methyltransferase family protein [Palleronia aestuarii]|uniref:Methyltransferase family protein n=1 Tax=Palleronia aestuarii TaxID=568105 RepID=A0A2W7Q709_9RHOB|nr:class I SAM-dependent methyltransferase [Palleronia aestuarii]PZX17549.1 methyltransferase family protein [Palleronia aestuarii]